MFQANVILAQLQTALTKFKMLLNKYRYTRGPLTFLHACINCWSLPAALSLSPLCSVLLRCQRVEGFGLYKFALDDAVAPSHTRSTPNNGMGVDCCAYVTSRGRKGRGRGHNELKPANWTSALNLIKNDILCENAARRGTFISHL